MSNSSLIGGWGLYGGEPREGRTLIPTMIVFGLVTGRWWRLALVAAAILWPALLLVDGVTGVSADLVIAALLGAVNAAVGAAVHQVLLWLARRVRVGTSRQPT